MPDQSRWEWGRRLWEPKSLGFRTCLNLGCLFLYLTVRIGRGQEKNQEAEVVFLSRPWLIWGEGALPGSVTHFLPQPEVCFHSPYCP